MKYALLAILLWSSVATAFKLALKEINPYTLLIYSQFVALLFLFIVVSKEKKLKLSFELLKKRPFRFIILATLVPTFYYLALFKAYSLLMAQETQLINYTWVFLITLFSPFVGKKVTIKDFIALIIGYFSIFILIGGFRGFDFGNIEGIIWALLSTLFWSIYWLLKIGDKVDPLIENFLVFFISFFLTAIIGFIEKFTINTLSYRAIFLVIWIGLFEMGVTFLIWQKALNSSSRVAKSTFLIYLTPFISLIIIHYILGEEIKDETIIAFLLLIVAIFINYKK